MGRRKISIAPIADDRNRQVTFLKRKNGLFKKAYELGVLCSADVAVVVFNANGKLFEFHSGDMDAILLRYSHYAGPPHEKRGPEDYMNKDLVHATKKGTGGRMTTLSDEDDEDDDEELKPALAAGSSGVKAIPSSKGKEAIKAAQERKAKEASLSRAGSEDPQLGASSLSRTNSQSSSHQPYPSPQHGPPPLQHLSAVHPPPGSQPHPMFPAMQVPAGMPLPYQHPGAAPPFGIPPFASSAPPNLSHPGFPSAIPAGVRHPTFPPMFIGAPSWPGASPHPSQPGTSVASGGVPAWFASPNPQAAALGHGGPSPGSLPSHAQLLQQLGGLPGGSPGWTDANASILAQREHQRRASQPQIPHHPPPTPAQSTLPSQLPTPNHASSPPQLAPMYGSPAAMTYSRDAAFASAAGPPATAHSQSHSRPGSVSSSHSQQGATLSLSRQNSLTGKPRLSVSIPAGSNMDEGKKPGLVTAGGASILGAGLEPAKGAPPLTQKPDGMDDDEGQPTAVPRSAFAADLLPSPFYPGSASASTSYAFPTTSSSVFTWPTTTEPEPEPGPDATAPPGPAPMLGVDDDPGLLRRLSADSQQQQQGVMDELGMINRLKRGSVDLEEGIQSMGMDSASEVGGGGVGSGSGSSGGGGAEDGYVSEMSDGNGGRVRKRRA
ncbi:hypothetical protein JCM11641_000752 [Rhodosporidiobolus odoratus]